MAIKHIWRWLGVVAFWLSWPLLYIYLRFGSRTRVLVVCGQQVLVVKGWLGPGRWSLPGGGLHRHESTLSGIVRELQEETGIVTDPEQLRPLFKATYAQDGLRFRYQCFVLELPEVLPITTQRFEITEALWLSKDRLRTSRLGSDVDKALSIWFKT